MKGRRISAQISAQVYCVLDLRHSPSLNCLYRLSSFNCSQKQQKPRPPYKRIKSWGEVELKQKKSQTSDVCLGIYVSAQKPQIDYNLKLPQRASNATILKGSELIIKEKMRKQLDDPTVGDWGPSRGEGYKGAAGGNLGGWGTVLYPDCGGGYTTLKAPYNLENKYKVNNLKKI